MAIASSRVSSAFEADTSAEVEREAPALVHRISIVVPVYRGGQTLRPLVEEIEPLTDGERTPLDHAFRVAELILVYDGAVDDSSEVMESLASDYPFVRLIWLSRNFGQHPATLAGMASTTSEWVVTLDEDGQQNPADIGRLLDRALEQGIPLVYAQPANPPPHGWLRNGLSALAKSLFVTFLSTGAIGRFNSFRLIHGEIARSLAAYCGNQVYLDVALSWVVAGSSCCPVLVRPREQRPSGYSFRKLAAHFGRLVLTSGTKPLRFISLLGLFSILLSGGVSGYALWQKLTAQVPVAGWTSIMIVLCFFAGCTLISLGIIAEYLGVTLTMAMGRPLYLVVSGPPRRKVPKV